MPPASESSRSGLLRRIAASSTWRSDEVFKGIGDDAAVLKKDGSTYILISSETLVEGVEFDLTFLPFHQLGAKAVSAAVSDICAMNGKPEAILVNLGVPNRVTSEMIGELYKGISMACTDYQCQLAGGDLTGSHHAFIVTVTVYGLADKKSIVFNSGAKKDQAICVTGDLGGALAGLKVLLREKKHWEETGDTAMQPDLSEYDFVVKKQLIPMARKDIVTAFRQHNVIPSAMTDVSKGLLPDLKRILAGSGCGAYIYQAALPVDLQTRKVADEMKEEVDLYALYGGEDYELLFTLDQEKVDQLAENCRDFTIIGKITDKKGVVEMQTDLGEIAEFRD